MQRRAAVFPLTIKSFKNRLFSGVDLIFKRDNNTFTLLISSLFGEVRCNSGTVPQL